MITRSLAGKLQVGVSRRKRKSLALNTPKMTAYKDRVSAKWSEDNDLIFIELCLLEVGKGNRPGTSLSKDGWKNVVGGFHSRTGRHLDQKKLKKRWDQMKKDWSLYENLMHRCSGIGWDPVKKTIDASNDWWEEQIAANKGYKKFRGKDLSIMSKYDELFRRTVATGMGARASTQLPGFDIEEPDCSFLGDAYADIHAEGSGDSDEKTPFQPATASHDRLFPPSPFETGTSSGSKRKRGNASSIKEGIQSLLNMAELKSTGTSVYVEPPVGPTIEECMHLLHGLDEVEKYSAFYYFSQSLFGKSVNRQIFMSQVDDRARVGWLGFLYAEYQRKN